MATREIKRRGILLVLSSPSGAGKTTITRALVRRDRGLRLSVSATTRPRRKGEIDGKHYHFVDQRRFDAMVQNGELLEHALVFGHSYGTPRAPVMAAIESGTDVVCDVDWQGTQQMKARLPNDLVSVFILPPSMAALEKRLKTRAQDSREVVRARMAKSADEMSHWDGYDYVVINRALADSITQVAAILRAERARRARQIGLDEFVNRLRGGN
ncbi:MAG TPA: guanylate kinase [Stellaceae bacterium]|jgi:guanylate kinase|nr:guanylate kinase [Stellaceae bacterium]